MQQLSGVLNGWAEEADVSVALAQIRVAHCWSLLLSLIDATASPAEWVQTLLGSSPAPIITYETFFFRICTLCTRRPSLARDITDEDCTEQKLALVHKLHTHMYTHTYIHTYTCYGHKYQSSQYYCRNSL